MKLRIFGRGHSSTESLCTTQTESDQQLLTQRFPSTGFNFSYSYMGDDPYDQDYDPYDLDYDPYDQDYD